MQTLVDELSRCKDRKEREEQIRMEEEWIENEVEERFREKWFKNEVGKRVMSEMDRQFKYKREEIQRIKRAAQKGWGYLSSYQTIQISNAAISNLQEPRTSLHRIDRRARQLCRENFSMSLNILHAHVNEMVHDLVKELWAGQNKGGGELDLGDKAGCYESSAQETSQRQAGRSEPKNWKISPFKCQGVRGRRQGQRLALVHRNVRRLRLLWDKMGKLPWESALTNAPGVARAAVLRELNEQEDCEAPEECKLNDRSKGHGGQILSCHKRLDVGIPRTFQNQETSVRVTTRPLCSGPIQY